jgi:hypothetical protein
MITYFTLLNIFIRRAPARAGHAATQSGVSFRTEASKQSSREMRDFVWHVSQPQDGPEWVTHRNSWLLRNVRLPEDCCPRANVSGVPGAAIGIVVYLHEWLPVSPLC